MATEPILATLDAPVVRPRGFVGSTALSDYWALTKPEVNFLIVVTTFAGFYLGCAGHPQDFPLWLSINTVFGTLLVAGGTGSLNQYIERRYDVQMRRTSRRPLAAGRLRSSSALWFGVALSVVGCVDLAIAVNVLASVLALATLLSYLFFYTPLKRKTPLCVLVGAFPGAMPPLIGWAGAAGKLSFEAWTLFATLFLWQFPHFMAIAWMYREDYDRAGYLVLPHDDRVRARFVDLQTVWPLSALVCASLLPALVGGAGAFYFIGASLLSLAFFYYGAQFVLRRTNSAARRLLMASIIYLPLLFVLMLLPRS